jgi:hypothetical protein
MSWVAAGVAAATATYQIGSSIYKNQKSKKMMEGNEYEIPLEAKQNLSDAQRQSLEGLPAEQQRQYLENIQQAQAVSIDAMQDRRGGLVGAAGVQASATQGYKDLLAMESQARVQNQQQLMQQRDVMAGYKDLEWKTNVFDPATELKKQASADQGAAMQNLAAGVTYAGQGISAQQGVTGQAMQTPTDPSLPQQRTWQDPTIDPNTGYNPVYNPVYDDSNRVSTNTSQIIPANEPVDFWNQGVGVYGDFQF